jgi:ABC-type sugar transport system substrate-binding protein
MSVIRRTPRALGAATLAIALIGVTVGCGSSDSSKGGGSSGTAAAKPKITMLTASNVIPGWIGYDDGAKAAAQRLGVDLKIQQWASLEPNDLVAGVNAVAASKPDAALFSAVNAPALQSALEQAAGRIHKVILFDSPATNPSFAATYVGSNNAEEGVAAAKKLAELIGDKGTVLQTSAQPSFGGLEINAKAFRDEMVKNHPNVNLLPLQRDDGDTSKNAAIMRATLARHPDLAGAYLGTSGLGGEGGVGALRAAGKAGQVKVMTLDGLPAAINDLRKGYQQAVVSTKLKDLGGGAVEDAVKALKGETLPKQTLVGFCVLTKDNLDQPDNQQCIFPSKK